MPETQVMTNAFTGSIEEFTQFQTVIQSDHAYIHRGYAQTAIIDLGSISAATYIGFTTPTTASGSYVH